MRIFVLMVVILMSGCSLLPRNYYTFYISNQSNIDLYDFIVRTDSGQLVDRTPGIKRSYPSGVGGGVARDDIPKLPNYLEFQWRESKDGPLIVRRQYLRPTLPKSFNGYIYSIIDVEYELKLSWVSKDRSFRTLGCGGHIFDNYGDIARPKIQKKLKEWRAYLDKKSADILAGNKEAYKVPKHYDEIDEIYIRCLAGYYMP